MTRGARDIELNDLGTCMISPKIRTLDEGLAVAGVAGKSGGFWYLFSDIGMTSNPPAG